MNGRGFCVYKASGRESGSCSAAAPVHWHEKWRMDGDFVYTRPVDGNQVVILRPPPSIGMRNGEWTGILCIQGQWTGIG